MRNGWAGFQESTKVAHGLCLGRSCSVCKQGDRFRSALPGNDVLRKIAHLLDEGLTADAIVLANFIRSDVSREFYKANFNPAEPRTEPGQWTRASASAVSPLVQEVQYRGHFHNAVVDDLIEGLNAKGSVAIGHVEVFGLNGVLAIPDAASRPNGWTKPYFIEVKTGDDPSFTPNQRQVYPLICQGGHAVCRSTPGSLGWALSPANRCHRWTL